MKNLCFVTDSLNSGGAERVLTIIANELFKLGYNVKIICKVHQPSFYELEDGITIIYPKTEINYKNFFFRVFTTLNVYLQIKNILNSIKPNVVIPFSTTTIASTVIISKLLGLKTIACDHLNYRDGGIFRYLIKRYIYPLSDMLTVLTQRDKDEFYGNFMNNVVVMPNPLSITPIEFIDKDKIKVKQIVAVGNVSRWHHKGFDILITLFKEFLSYESDWNLIIVGGGDGTYLNNLITNFSLEDRVTLLGSSTNITEQLNKSSIFALTSRKEGLPMVLIEAMSQGLACIAFDCYSGPRDILTNETDGLLIEDQNTEEFLKGIIRLTREPELRLKLGRAAVATSKKYSKDIITNKWVELLENLD